MIVRETLQGLLDALVAEGYRTLGPTLREEAIVYDDVTHVSELPAGWTDSQEAGHYRLQRREDDAWLGFNVGPHSWKRFLHPPLEPLWSVRRNGDGSETTVPAPGPKLAFIGVRACELRAIAIQDRVFLGGRYSDDPYPARGMSTFIVAVNCGQAGGTCCCVSMSSGPKVGAGFDLSLTELLGTERTTRHLLASLRIRYRRYRPHRMHRAFDIAEPVQHGSGSARHRLRCVRPAR